MCWETKHPFDLLKYSFYCTVLEPNLQYLCGMLINIQCLGHYLGHSKCLMDVSHKFYYYVLIFLYKNGDKNTYRESKDVGMPCHLKSTLQMLNLNLEIIPNHFVQALKLRFHVT